jgi:hypothetical protein
MDSIRQGYRTATSVQSTNFLKGLQVNGHGVHIQHIRLKGDKNNNKMERFNRPRKDNARIDATGIRQSSKAIEFTTTM